MTSVAIQQLPLKLPSDFAAEAGDHYRLGHVQDSCFVMHPQQSPESESFGQQNMNLATEYESGSHHSLFMDYIRYV